MSDALSRPEAGDDRLALEYLGALWPDGLPPAGFLTVAQPRAHGGKGWTASQFADLGAAAAMLTSAPDRYLTMTAMRRIAKGRGRAADAVALPCLWLDFDTSDGKHAAENLPTREEALEFLAALPLPPSIVLASGGGLYAIWLLDAPWTFTTDEDRTRAAKLSRGWQSHVRKLAADRGWHVDETSGLERCLRAPGSLNGKYDPPRKVQTVDHSTAPRRFARTEFEPFTAGATAHRSAPTPRDKSGAPTWLALAGSGLGGIERTYTDTHGGGIVLRECPFCRGAESAGSIVEGSAHVASRSGVLRCKRASCEAADGRGGIPLEIWIERLEPSIANAVRVARVGETSTSPALTEDANAHRLLHDHGRDVCFVHGDGWRGWDGRRFASLPTSKSGHSDALMARARGTARKLLLEVDKVPEDRRAAFFRHARESLSERGLRSAVALLRSDCPMPAAAFDRDPYLLNLLNGTLDLRTGELRPHRREDRLALLAGAAFRPDARCADLERFLEHLVGGDVEFLEYLQRALGFILCGAKLQDVVFLALGQAGTGKSTLLEVLLALLGEYAGTIPFGALLERDRGQGPRPEIVAMRGKRLVCASEAPERAKLDSATLKAISGGDTIAPRGLYLAPDPFRANWTTLLAVNDPPRLDPKDSGARRRLAVLPFEHEVADPEFGLRERLRERDALEALLAFAVRGFAALQKRGSLGTCSAVEVANLRYWEEGASDVALHFVDSALDKVSDSWTPSATRLEAAKSYTDARGLRGLSSQALAGALRARRYIPKRDKACNGWYARLRDAS